MVTVEAVCEEQHARSLQDGHITVVHRWCNNYVTLVVQWSYRIVTMVFQCCYSGITVVLPLRLCVRNSMPALSRMGT
jgi:hypothetical protein